MTSQTLNTIPTPEQIRRAPKVLLHDHLDGGLRPATIVELARETGYDALPETDAGQARRAGSARPPTPVRWSATWRRSRTPCGVMQTRDALVRVAAECAEDLAADGVVYAEVRYAPEQHLEEGLTLEEVVEAVNEGFREGERRAARRRQPHPRRRPADRDAARGPRPGDRRTRQPLPRRRASSASTSPAPRRATRPPATSTPSSTSSGRTTTSRSTRARRSACRRSGRRCSGAAPTGSATACASSTTSRSPTTAR